MIRIDSIRIQILLLIVGTALVSVVVAISYSGRYWWNSAKDSRSKEAETVSTLLARNSLVAVSFDDPQAATALLSSLEARPEILGAILLDYEGQPFASYGTLTDVDELDSYRIPSLSKAQSLYQESKLVTIEPLHEMSEQIGTLITVTETSDIYDGFRAFLLNFALVITIGLVFVLLASAHFLDSIVYPVVKLTEVARRVSQSGDYGLRVPTVARGEVGVLCQQFNDMLSEIQTAHQHVIDAQEELSQGILSLEQRVQQRTFELEDAVQQLVTEVTEKEEVLNELKALQSELVESSRAAGMAEIANGVLHNIGNVLNSVKVATTVAAEKVDRMDVGTLNQVTYMLQKKQRDMGDDWIHFEGLKHLPRLLSELAASLEAGQANTVTELKEVHENVEFIAEIVRSQQSYARQPGVHEPTYPAELFDSAIKMVGATSRSGFCEIERRYEYHEQVSIDKNKTLQVLCNFVKNGIEAMVDKLPDQRVLKVEIRNPKNDPGMVIFSVTDQGSGVSPEAMQQMFSFGFTTKSTGHGFGLHSSACAAKEMGGEVQCFSEGIGQGATFELRLPTKPLKRSETESRIEHAVEM